MIKRLINILLTISLISGVKAQITTSQELINSMYEGYSEKWYTNLTFTQKTTYYQEGEISKEETWYEAMRMPEGLIIKIGSLDSGDGMIFRSDSMHMFSKGRLVRSSRRVHDLLVLGFSVYFDPPSATLNKLVEAGYDLSVFTEAEDHYIIGNPASKQVWIEKDRLLFSKSATTHPDGSVSTVAFNKYEKLGGGWIAPEVLFYRDNQIILKEEYQNISTPENLDGVLDLHNFQQINW